MTEEEHREKIAKERSDEARAWFTRAIQSQPMVKNSVGVSARLVVAYDDGMCLEINASLEKQ